MGKERTFQTWKLLIDAIEIIMDFGKSVQIDYSKAGKDTRKRLFAILSKLQLDKVKECIIVCKDESTSHALEGTLLGATAGLLAGGAGGALLAVSGTVTASGALALASGVVVPAITALGVTVPPAAVLIAGGVIVGVVIGASVGFVAGKFVTKSRIITVEFNKKREVVNIAHDGYFSGPLE